MIREGVRLWPIRADVEPVYPAFFRESTGGEEFDDDKVSSCGDFQSGFYDLDYLTVSQLIGKDLLAELIIHGFLGLGSLQFIMPQSSEETNERDSSLADKVTSFVDSSSSKTSKIKFDYGHQSEASYSDSDFDTDYQSNSENVEVDEDEWLKLDEDFNDEDWEII
ncbi:uncharacterized protein LOC121780624 isoform X1 [Salvia splendens]|uniref:uncharacterized protein LOC121780624 isoform X1 n=1 Tax=Salvia splendens TaxID=180675 RepID=UPI001C256EBB|nr:uncharacterized protein LOC121780624 isoform X1 [Salvia splendens]